MISNLGHPPLETAPEIVLDGAKKMPSFASASTPELCPELQYSPITNVRQESFSRKRRGYSAEHLAGKSG
jgi:hypothetical protein